MYHLLMILDLDLFAVLITDFCKQLIDDIHV